MRRDAVFCVDRLRCHLAFHCAAIAVMTSITLLGKRSKSIVGAMEEMNRRLGSLRGIRRLHPSAPLLGSFRNVSLTRPFSRIFASEQAGTYRLQHNHTLKVELYRRARLNMNKIIRFWNTGDWGGRSRKPAPENRTGSFVTGADAELPFVPPYLSR